MEASSKHEDSDNDSKTISTVCLRDLIKREDSVNEVVKLRALQSEIQTVTSPRV